MVELTHQRGELPTAPREAYVEMSEILAVAMRLAIPQTDWGSRGAIYYAVDIAEMLALLHVQMTPGPNFSSLYVDEARTALDAEEPIEAV